MLSRFITGVQGLELSAAEKHFLKDARPCGLILFARNCTAPAQLTALIEAFKEAVGSEDLLISIDQEGGRVQRLGPPHWRALPPAQSYGRQWQLDAPTAETKTRLAAHLIAQELRAQGINCNMVPVLDVPQEEAHEIISDRAYGDAPEPVGALGRAVAEGHMAGGVMPVMKHIPGHGRALADSHEELPVVPTSLCELRDVDFAPFRALNDLPAAMSAHVVYSAIDPDNPASISPLVHEDIIRGDIGFDGLLMSDDLSMKALQGDFADRAAAVLAAGSDLVLHCNGNLVEMEQIASAVPPLDGRSLERFKASLALTRERQPVDISAAEAVICESLAVTP